MRTHPPMPTPGQCSAGARVDDFSGSPAFACWYPQMGGCVGRCVVVITPGGGGRGDHDRCFEAYIWHDGEFPFDEDLDGNAVPPAHIHHCMPSQFVGFGEWVIGKQREHP